MRAADEIGQSADAHVLVPPCETAPNCRAGNVMFTHDQTAVVERGYDGVPTMPARLFWETLTPYEDRMLWRMRVQGMSFAEIRSAIEKRRKAQALKRGRAKTSWNKWLGLKWRADWRSFS